MTEFVRNEYRTHVIIDFSKASPEMMSLFDDASDLDRFFMRLQLLTGVTLHERESAIVFDEIQLCPPACQMIKHLVADHRYDYIETGSLISIVQNVKDILVPSEEFGIDMYPMDFEEWLWANGMESTMGILHHLFDAGEPLGLHMHMAMMERFRTYMVIGGMPQVVGEYLRTNNVMIAEKKKREILDLYRKDMMKLPKGQYEYAKALFDGIPSLLSQRNKKFMPGRIMVGSRSRSFSKPIMWLDDAKIVLTCDQCNDPSVTVNLTRDASSRKLYLLDTGLLISLAFGNGGKELADTYRMLIDGKLSINEGMFFENAVAQQLASQGFDLLFYEFQEGSSNYEVDFIIPGRKGIIPIEVKSSSSSRHRSLDRFMSKYRSRIDGSYVIHGKDLRVEGDITYLPIYMVPFLLEHGDGETVTRVHD